MPRTSTPSRRGEPGDRAEHRHAVVAAGVERAAAQAAGAADDEAVLERLDLGAERRAGRRRPPRSGPTPCGAAPPAPVTTVSPSAKQPSSATSGSSSIASGTSAAPTRVPSQRSAAGDDRRRAARCPPPRPLVDLERAAHPVDDPEEAAAGRVEADAVEHAPRCRATSSAAATKKAADERSPGTVDRPELEGLGRPTRDPRSRGAARRRERRRVGDLDRRPGGAQHALGVVARRRGLGDRSSRRRPAGRRAAGTT